MPMSWKTRTGGSIFLTPLIFGQNKTVPNEDDIDIMISTWQFLSGSLDTLFNSSLKASLWSGLKAQWKHSGTIICQMNENTGYTSDHFLWLSFKTSTGVDKVVSARKKMWDCGMGSRSHGAGNGCGTGKESPLITDFLRARTHMWSS